MKSAVEKLLDAESAAGLTPEQRRQVQIISINLASLPQDAVKKESTTMEERQGGPLRTFTDRDGALDWFESSESITEN